MKARADQVELAQQALEILDEADYAYVEAPPGVGKSLTMALIGDGLDIGGVRLIVVGLAKIARQLRANFEHFAAAGILRDPAQWRIETWQKARTLVGKAGVLLFDECHLGGSKGTSSLQAIVRNFRPEKKVWVSATPWDVDESVLGARHKHTARMSFEQARAAKLINPTDLLRVDCGLAMQVAAERIEALSGRRVHDLAARDADEILSLLSGLQARTGVSPRALARDLEDLVRYRVDLGTDLYQTIAPTGRCVFFCPRIDYAEHGAERWNARSGITGRAVAITNRMAKSRADDLLDQFVVGNPDLQALYIVRMLREGFDLPELSDAFDLAWNPDDPRSTVQKLGRITRVHPGKPRGRYFYAVDARALLGRRAPTDAAIVIPGTGTVHRQLSAVEKLLAEYAGGQDEIVHTAQGALDPGRQAALLEFVGVLRALGADPTAAERETAVKSQTVRRPDGGADQVEIARAPIFQILAAAQTSMRRAEALERLPSVASEDRANARFIDEIALISEFELTQDILRELRQRGLAPPHRELYGARIYRRDDLTSWLAAAETAEGAESRIGYPPGHRLMCLVAHVAGQIAMGATRPGGWGEAIRAACRDLDRSDFYQLSRRLAHARAPARRRKSASRRVPADGLPVTAPA